MLQKGQTLNIKITHTCKQQVQSTKYQIHNTIEPKTQSLQLARKLLLGSQQENSALDPPLMQ